MKTTVSKWATKAAGAGAVALLLATPALAQSRGDWNRNQGQEQRRDSRDNNTSRNNNSSRDNQRINGSGRITSLSHERDGYRLRLDNDQRSYWVPQSAFGSRARDLRVGVSIGLGGIFRGDAIYVDAVSWPDDGYGYDTRGGNAYGYDNGYLRGVVERVDYRDGTLRIREQRSGRIITADLGGSRHERNELRNVRRGDFVSLSGQWLRGGVFDVARIERR